MELFALTAATIRSPRHRFRVATMVMFGVPVVAD
jgi:hypothetical protein